MQHVREDNTGKKSETGEYKSRRVRWDVISRLNLGMVSDVYKAMKK